MRFSENQCRVCRKVFCCEKCRVKHEINVHEINVNCDICNHGYLVLKNINELLLPHIKKNHWPLHCVLCKYTFRTVQDLRQHSKCLSVGCKEDSPNTPYRNPAPLILVPTEDSPILTEIQLKDSINLITSTPMQRTDHVKKDFNKNDEVVTPVDHLQTAKPPDSGNSMQVTKRRVTFYEMSIAGKNDTPERELDEVGPKLLSEQFSSELKEPFTPKRPNPSSDNPEPELQFSTPARFDQSIFNDDQPLEFSTPAPFTYSDSNQNDAGATDPGDQWQDEFKQEIKGIMSHNKINDNEASVSNDQQQDKDTDNENLEKEALKQDNQTYNENYEKEALNKEGSTIWMSALNLSEELSNESDKDNEINENILGEKSDDLSRESSKDSPPQIISSPPKVAHPTPILKKNCVNSDNLNNISSINRWSPPKAAQPTSILKNTIDSEEKVQNSPQIIIGCSTAAIIKEINHLEEDSLPATPNSSAISKILKMHPTPHPILKRGEVNRELMEHNENGTPNTHEKSPENKIVKVQPTSIIRRTNIHMKFQIPAHLSSTPILNMHPQPKFVNKVSTQQIFLQHGEANYCETSTTEMLRQINEDECISGIGKDSNSLSVQDNFAEAHNVPDAHTSNDSRSNIWTSMTRMVKRVIQRTVSFSNDSYSLRDSNRHHLAIASHSFKRHYSESDSPEMAMAPRSKRFKFTDIKCRRPIRDLSPPRPSRMLALPSTSASGATFEIIKSVTTAHSLPDGKTYADKATQTDDFFEL